jgi:hypothetical protein
MKKLCTVAFLGLFGLGLTAQSASAWWWTNWCCEKHGPKIHCRQYNAFSPYCCGPLPHGYCWEGNHHQDCCDGDSHGGYVGEPVVIGRKTEVIGAPAESSKKPEKSEEITTPKQGPQSALPGNVPQQFAGQRFVQPPYPVRQFAQPPYAGQQFPQQPYAQLPYPPQGYPQFPNPQFQYPNPGFGQLPMQQGYPTGPVTMPNANGYGPSYWYGNSPTGGR